jgi:hypothetical protein
MKDLDAEIKKIISETPHLPAILENILNHNSVISSDEEIIDYIYLERQGFVPTENFFEKKSNWQPATLIIATSYGISILEEGGTMIVDRVYGYRIKHILYEKITSLELDISLLAGVMIIYSNNSSSEIKIGFNTAHDYEKFERFIDVVRRKILESSLRL